MAIFKRMVRLAFFYLIILIVTYFVSNNPFFWDTVQLASKHAHFFYDTDFQSLILPEAIDSGHPPLFGMYIAWVWKIFGKTLPVSHFAMLPFLFGIVFFLQKIGTKLLGKKWAPWLLLLCLADPVLAGQMVLVSPDLMLVCFFLMCLWAIWSNRPSLIALAVVGLGLTSMRGMMLGVGMFGFSLFASGEKIDIRLFFKKLWPFLPGGLLAAGYLFYHWMETGWVGYHENSTWAPSFERVDFQGFVKNIGILVWRLLDFGRVFIWGVLVIFIWVCWKKLNWRISKPDRRQTGWQLAALSAIIFLALGPSQLFYQGLLAHRYFLPFFLSLNFLILYLIKGRGSLQLEERWRKLAASVLCLGLATGNFWVYPQKIAMGWDSTLAHLPWNGLQNQVQDYLKKAAIPYNKVGTAFPNIGPRETYELNGVGEGFVEKNLLTNCYIFYSNIMNDFTDAEIDELQQRWEVVFERQVCGVCAVLYQNPNLTGCEN